MTPLVDQGPWPDSVQRIINRTRESARSPIRRPRSVAGRLPRLPRLWSRRAGALLAVAAVLAGIGLGLRWGAAARQGVQAPPETPPLAETQSQPEPGTAATGEAGGVTGAPATGEQAGAGAAAAPEVAKDRREAGLELPPAAGTLPWPVVGEVIVPFGWAYSRTHADWRYHQGIDVRTAPDTPVTAPLPGRVDQVLSSPLHGTTVILDHGRRVRTVYSHLQAATVRPGQALDVGEVLGYVGDPGLAEVAEGPHLHFELWTDGQPRDPFAYLVAR